MRHGALTARHAVTLGLLFTVLVVLALYAGFAPPAAVVTVLAVMVAAVVLARVVAAARLERRR